MDIDGIGPPLVTPFDERGAVDHDRLRTLVDWLERRGVDFLVPCGSTSEAPLLTHEERTNVIETVTDTASVPVIAGTGHPGLQATQRATEAAANAGADAALVVTPFYFDHDQATLAAYYRDLADAVSIPILLYSVPQFTGVHLEPSTIGSLATHENIAGLKDSAGVYQRVVRTQRRVPAEFSIFVGSADLLAAGQQLDAAGGILAVANLDPSLPTEILAVPWDDATARRAELVSTITEQSATVLEYGIPGLKWAMRQRDIPAGYPRRPHRELDSEARQEIETALATL